MITLLRGTKKIVWTKYCQNIKDNLTVMVEKLGHEVRRSKSSLTLYLYHLVDRIQTTVKAQLFSNLTCMLLMKRGGTLLILGQRSRSSWALCV